MIGRSASSPCCRQDAVVVSTARGTAIDLDALEAALRDGRLAGAGLDVLPVEPPVEPIPDLLRAYRAREPLDDRPPDHHAALGLLVAGGAPGHPHQVGRDDAGGAVQQPPAERDRAGGLLRAERLTPLDARPPWPETTLDPS